MSHQPLNTLAPFKVQGSKFVIDENGNAIVNVIAVDTVLFKDGSFMSSAGGGLPSTIDEGTF